MPFLNDETQSGPIKMLVAAHSGFGKTGALASLAKAGYKLHILDMDNGTDILLDTSILPPQFRGNVEVETRTDKYKVMGSKAVPISATAWTLALTQLDAWMKLYNNPDNVIVIDSLTFLSEAALRHVLGINNRLDKKAYQSDWGDAQRLVEDCLGLLYSKDTKCHVLVNTHIAYQGGPDAHATADDKPNAETVAPLKGYPTSIGKALSPKIGRYFNNLLVGKTLGDGQSAARLFYTNPVDLVDAKSSRPAQLKSTYAIGTGLAEIFAVLGAKPASA